MSMTTSNVGASPKTSDHALSPSRTPHLVLALQTSTSSSSAAASPTTTITTGSTLSPTSSPPLVLAFLAIALFSAAMIFIFGWRRIQLRRGWRVAVVRADIDRLDVELPTIPVDVPKLWDLSNGGSFVWGQVRGEGAGSEVDVTWVNLMPLSLSAKEAGESIEPRQQHSLNNLIPNLNLLSQRNHRQLASSRHDDGEKKKSKVDDGMKVTMQVAVAIMLPSPEYPVHIKNRNNDKRDEVGKNVDRQRMTDYCIGMYECSWQ